MVSNKIPTSVALDRHIIEKLDNEIDELGMDTRSQVIRYIIRKYFEKKD